MLLSRVMGYLRDAAIGNRLGAGPVTDAYYAAFQIPDILNYLLAGGALSIAFVPLYVRARDDRGPEAAGRLFAVVLGTVGVLSLAATAALFGAAERLVAFQFPAFDAETQALCVHLTRIVLPAQFFFVTGGIVRAVLMAEERFASQALAPLLYNGSSIVGGLLTGTAEGFAWGVLAGAVLGPFLVPCIDLARTHALRVRWAPLSAEFRVYLWTALPLMLGLSLTTVDEWYDKWFGAALGAGVVSVLSFARKLMQAPVAIIGQAVATAALPTFARLHHSGRNEELDHTLLQTLRGVLSLGLLTAAWTALFAEPVVELVYHHGRFSAEAAAETAALLGVFAWGVPGWVVQQLALRAFYARGDTWRPMILATAIALAAVPLYLALGREHGARGLAAAGALAMSANALLTLVWARQRHGGPLLGALAATGARSLAIAAAAALAAGLASGAIRGATTLAGDPLALVLLGPGSAVFGVVALLGVRWLGDASTRRLTAGLLRRIPGLRGLSRALDSPPSGE